MPTPARSSIVATHARTLALGGLAAAGIWLAGHPELSWLGFAQAAMIREAGRCRPFARRRAA